MIVFSIQINSMLMRVVRKLARDSSPNKASEQALDKEFQIAVVLITNFLYYFVLDRK